MRRLIVTVFAFSAVSSFAQTAKPFTLSGKINHPLDSVRQIYINYRNDEGRVRDSAVPVNGMYTFKGNISSPTQAQISVAYVVPKKSVYPRDFYTVFLEPANIKTNHTDSFSNVKITGSKAQTAFDNLTALLKPSADKQAAIMKQYSAAVKDKNEEEVKRLDKEYDALDAEQNAVYESYLKKNPNSPISLYVLQQYGGYDIDAKKVEPYYAKLPAALKASPAGKQYASRIDIAKKTAVGAMAMDFTQNDTLGVPVKLSSLRGKYLLVDFWASWCGPCRRENPNVVAAFNKYKEKGFHILGVSLDQPGAQDKWVKAIHDDQLTWTQVSDLKYWDNEVAKQYGVQAIPQNFLIDPSGKIIGKNLRGDDLKNKLAEIFDGK